MATLACSILVPMFHGAGLTCAGGAPACVPPSPGQPPGAARGGGAPYWGRGGPPGGPPPYCGGGPPLPLPVGATMAGAAPLPAGGIMAGRGAGAWGCWPRPCAPGGGPKPGGRSSGAWAPPPLFLRTILSCADQQFPAAGGPGGRKHNATCHGIVGSGRSWPRQGGKYAKLQSCINERCGKAHLLCYRGDPAPGVAS